MVEVCTARQTWLNGTRLMEKVVFVYDEFGFILADGFICPRLFGGPG